MSHTDKTRPVMVQVLDPENRRYVIEKHDHTKGVCTLQEWLETAVHGSLWGHTHCHLYVSYYGWNGLKPFRRPPRKSSWDRYGRHGRFRADWRQMRDKILRAEDVDDVDWYAPRRKEMTGRIIDW